MATDVEIRMIAGLNDRARSMLIEELAEREAEPVPEINCVWCGTSTERTQPAKKFCSVRCRVAFSRKKSTASVSF